MSGWTHEAYRCCWLKRAALSALTLAACSGPEIGGPDGPAGGADAPLQADAASPTWALYTIQVGAHDASLAGAQPGNPVRGLATVGGRDYRFRLDPSAVYTITNPAQPDDQFDWNKLPGLSDCGNFDLSVNGAMFGWRWRLDTTPNVLEITAYANNNSQHLTPMDPLFTLDADDLASDAPLHYRVWLDGSLYRFAVSGQVRQRPIDATATLPRICPASPTSTLKWAAGLYFGGTSTAPSVVTGRVLETKFVPQ